MSDKVDKYDDFGKLVKNGSNVASGASTPGIRRAPQANETAMKRIKTDRARSEFGAVVNEVAYGKEWIVLERRGKPMAAMIPMEDLRLLERLIEEEEDRIDLEEVRKALAEPGPNIPLDDLMEELRVRGKNRRSGAGRPAKPAKAARG
jgi:antitoxin Phd